MRPRLLVIGLLIALLLVLWVGILFLPRTEPNRPAFLASAQPAPVQESHPKSAPFSRKTGPHTAVSLGTAGVSCFDYLLPSTFGDVFNSAKAELASWDLAWVAPDNPPVGVMIPVSKMSAVFTHGDDAVTIFREPVDGQVRVRVWHRSATFGNLF